MVKVVYIFLILSLIVVYSYRQFIRPIQNDHKLLIFFGLGIITKLLGAYSLTLLVPAPFGDTYEYFQTSQVFLDAFTNDFETGLKLFFQAPENWNWDTRYYGDQFMQHIKWDTDSFTFVKIIFLMSLFTGGNYLLTVLLFGWISHLFLWKIFRATKDKIALNNYIWIGIIYGFPSCAFWASGILKDTFTYWILCFMFLWRLKHEQQLQTLKYYLPICLGLILLLFLKAYLFLSIVFVLIFTQIYDWGFKRLRFNILTNFFILSLLNLLIVLLISTLIYWLPHHISQYNILGFLYHLYDIENWNTRPGQNTSFHYGDQAWDVYKLILVSPIALFTGLFRPFLWETKSLMMVIFSLESTALLVLTFWSIKRYGQNILVRISQNKALLFLSLSTVFFAYIIGMTTFNFGALSRYKTPIFFFIMVFIYYWSKKSPKKIRES